MLDVRAQLRTALRGAMKSRDRRAVGALRSMLGIIDNAEAADPAAAPEPQSGTIAGGVTGLGAGEVARRELSDEEVLALVDAECSRWESLAVEYGAAGAADQAAALRAEVAVVRRALAG
jgi:uncharacterized protein YqeY